MRFVKRKITTEIEVAQQAAGMRGRTIAAVYLTPEEMEEFAEETKALGYEEDPRKVPAHDCFRWNGTTILKEDKP